MPSFQSHVERDPGQSFSAEVVYALLFYNLLNAKKSVLEPDMTLVISKRLDCRNIFAPMQVVALRRAINALPVGHVLELISLDPHAPSDLPAWCRCTGHEMVDVHQRENEYIFYIRKSA
jgi:tRNA 2-thiouridine synthesizing protein A